MLEKKSNLQENNQKPGTKEMKIIKSIQQIIFGLNKENISQAAQSIIFIFDYSYPYSFNIVMSHYVIICIFIEKNDFDIYLNFMKEIEKFQETNKVKSKIFDVFTNFLLFAKFIDLDPNYTGIYEQKLYYPLLKMYENNILDLKILKDEENPYFIHYMSKEEIYKQKNFSSFNQIIANYEELSKNDWELHKKYIEEGHNPNEIAKIIRNDEIEKLQEISSQPKFDFNQRIKPSLYERCSFVNKKNVTLIEYAAFFSSIKCFKYLLMNGANVENTGKYAIACGNEEIIHLCEQNHSSFKDAYETAIEFHRNDIFNYLYENRIIEIDDIEKLGSLCIMFWNIEVFMFLQKNGMKINENILNNMVKIGNLYLIKYFLKENPIPKNIFAYSPELGNIELVEYLLNQKKLILMLKIFICLI